MDKKSQWDKLFKMSLDPPTEFPKTQCLNRPIHYREACIDYVKKTMRCVGYRDYLVTELEKLAKIEEIINETNRRESVLVNPEPKIIVRSMGFDKIREVLENE